VRLWPVRNCRTQCIPGRARRRSHRASAADLDGGEGPEEFWPACQALNAIVRALELIGKVDGSLQSSPGSLHLHKHEHVTIGRDFTDDTEWAMLVREATRNFDEGEIRRLKKLCSGRAAALLVDSKHLD